MRPLFITGIGTDVGKTIVSAILVEALKADYWKPIQAGNLGFTDTDLVRSLVSNLQSKFHPEVYRLSAPMSPHAAAKIDAVKISLEQIKLPASQNTLIIEGAGGLLVPLAQGLLVRDLIAHLNARVIVVSRNYLGSINHSLLTLEALKVAGLEVLGVIFNGEHNSASEEFILEHSKLKCLGKIGLEPTISSETIRQHAHKFKDLLK